MLSSLWGRLALLPLLDFQPVVALSPSIDIGFAYVPAQEIARTRDRLGFRLAGAFAVHLVMVLAKERIRGITLFAVIRIPTRATGYDDDTHSAVPYPSLRKIEGWLLIGKMHFGGSSTVPPPVGHA